jgi:glycosyltransferase involved in cell wall biosynthesis
MRGEAGDDRAASYSGVRCLVHLTTVPMTLRFLEGQVRFVRRAGLEVHALSSPGEGLQEFGRIESIPVHGVPMTRAITPLADLRSLARLTGLLRRLKPSIVHAHTPKAGLLGMIAAWLCKVPVRIYHIHGLPFMTATGWKRWLLRTTERVACTLASRVLCVSRSVREVAIAEGLCPTAKIAVLLGGSINGVDATDRFRPSNDGGMTRRGARARYWIPADARVLGFIGRIVRDKGIVELAHAWYALRDMMPDLHLLLVGPLEPQDPVPTEVIRSLHRDPRVHLVGLEWDTPPLYTAMDVLVLPTYREGFPVVPLEAAAMGLPVVATRVPGCVDAVVDGETGALVPARDVEALAAALRAYLGDPRRRAAHGAAGRARVLQDFDQTVIWEATVAEYRRLLSRIAEHRILVTGVLEAP